MSRQKRSDSISSLESNSSGRSITNTRPKKKSKKYSYPSDYSDSDCKENRRPMSRYINASPKLSYQDDKSNLSYTKYQDDKSNLSYTKDSEIAEIDARLNALQTYLKAAKKRQYVD